MMQSWLLEHYILLGSMAIVSVFVIYLTFGHLVVPSIY